MKKIAASIALVGMLMLTATGCWGDDSRGKGDSGVAGGKGEDSKAFCTNMPNDFSNVCGKCVAHFPPWATLTTTSGALVTFQAPDQCGGKVVAGPKEVGSNVVRVSDGS